jgi:hypothetical protein
VVKQRNWASSNIDPFPVSIDSQSRLDGNNGSGPSSGQALICSSHKKYKDRESRLEHSSLQ